MIPARAAIAFLFAIQSLGGLRLEEAISILQRQGLTVVYSSALVKPEMRVEREPRATTPRGKLEEILTPLGLRVVEGPRHELLVVAGAKPAPHVEPPPPVPEARYRDEIVVKPTPRPATSETAAKVESISRDELGRMSDPSGDLTRTMQRLPGITATEASAAFGIRGGTPGQTIIAVDGLELSEPFHLRNFFKLFSTLDSSSVGHVDLMTGAFPAEWGDRIGGVIDVNLLSSAPRDSESSSLTLGTLNSRLSTLGTTPDRNTSWIFTTRGWYPDAILNFDKSSSELISTDCYDVLGKVEHRFTPRTTASISFLSTYDNLAYRNFGDTEVDRSAAHERSSHFWLTGRTDWSDSVSMRSILAVGRLSQNRVGTIVGNDALQITDSRGYNFVELKQDWRVSAPGSQSVKFGFDARTSDARYGYSRTATNTLPVDVNLQPHEQAAAVYASDGIPLGAHAAAEVGVRWDRQSLRGGDAQLSPRVNFLWAIAPGTNVRLGWGRYYQSQRLNELQVEDGVTQFAVPELAEHRNVSFDHRFDGGLSLSVDAFDDPMVNVRPRFENALNPIDVFPEAQMDRVLVAPSSSRARGVEMRVTGRAGGRTGWWASYTLSRATDRIDGRDVPRSWDQPRAAIAGFNVDLQQDWSASLTGTYHSGWPTTPVGAVANPAGASLVLGERNSERLPTFFRLDARVAKSLHATRGELLLTLDIVNLTNHNNVCCLSDVSAFDRGDGTFGVHREDRSLVPFFPLLSAIWKF